MADLTERLKLVVDATTGNAESSFDRMTTSAERSARAVDDSAEAVGRAADAVAQARNREADAAGKLAVAEAKLAEARARYGENSSQVVAAEERVASAQRGVQTASRQTASALEAQEEAQRKATDATTDDVAETDRAARGTERFRDEVGGLRDNVVGLVAGVSLADWLSESVAGYTEGARGAGQLAMSMNATTEEAGRFLAVASQLGLEMDDLLEIQASFAEVVGNDAEALSSFGAEVVKNSDGTTNWSLTLQSALANLQRIPDATKRNQLGFQLFGEEGYKQMARLLLSGKSVDEVFSAMGTPFTDADVEATRRFDAAMADLSAAGGGVSRELGSVLVPIITAMVQGFGLLVDVVTAVPAPIAVATIAAIAFGFANRALAESGGLVAATMTAAQGAMGRFTGAAAGAAAGSGAAALAMGGLRVAAGGVAGLLGGPLGIALVAVGAGFALLNAVTGDNSEQTEAAAQAQESLASALKESGGVITENVRRQAALAAQEAGILEQAEAAGISRGEVTRALLEGGEAYDRVRQQLLDYAEANRTVYIADEGGQASYALNEQGEAANDAAGALEDLRGTTEDTAASEAELAGELGETADKAAVAKAALEALTAALDGGNVSTADLSRLAGEAAQAQDAETASADRATAAIDAYRATTTLATEATRERIDATYSAESAEFAFLDAMDAANAARDDSTTSTDEQREAMVKLMQSALSAADAQADAAIEAREAAGDVLTDLDRANIRASEVIGDLRARLNTPGLSAGAQAEMQALIDQLVTAQENGDIEAVLRLTGAQETASGIDEAAEDRETTVTVESRNGPAVIRYLDGIANAERLSLVRVESRNGPAVRAYLDGLATERLAIIRVETRNGPAVRAYLDELATERTVRLNVERTGATGATGAPATGLRGAPDLMAVGAGAGAYRLGSVTLDLELRGSIDKGQLSRAQRGRAIVEDVRAYERENGTGWRRSP